MGKFGYTIDADPERTAKALGYEMRISPKKAYEVCKAIRGMKVKKAIDFLQDIIDFQKPLRLRRYLRECAHKKGKGFGAGRYPVKAAKAILEVIEDAKNNAEYKGWDADEMRILQIAAHRGRKIKNWMPRARGRSTEWFEQTTNIEVILEKPSEEEG